jgi:hypothetical protein
MPFRPQVIDVHSTRKSRSIEFHTLRSGSLPFIHQHCHFASEQVVYNQLHLADR